MCAAREGSKTSAFRETNASPCRANAGEWSDHKKTLEDPEDAAASRVLRQFRNLHAQFHASHASAFIPANTWVMFVDVEKMCQAAFLLVFFF